MNYDDDMLRQINENADLLSYVSQFIELRKNGKNYVGICPFHNEKTPSFVITPQKNRFHCFGCGTSGGMIGFLMRFEYLSFEDAVNKAASLASVDLSKMCHSQTMTFLKKYRSSKIAPKQAYEHQILAPNIMEKYKKCSVQEWIGEGIKQEVMDLFGVRFDEYSNRIVYPVYDIDKNLINVKGRTLYKNYKQMKLAKYMNYYEVGVMDYFQCLETTLPYIKEKNEIIIFESFKSVLKMFGWDYKNCVSAEKHVLTPEQIDILIKLGVDVVLAYDCDMNYSREDIKADIEKLRRVTNLYVIEDRYGLLGGEETKNSPADCGKEIWDELYEQRRKIV